MSLSSNFQLNVVLILLLLLLVAAPADAWPNYAVCRMACNQAYLSCMSVYGVSPSSSAS